MNNDPARRRRMIAELLRSDRPASQEELAEKLATAGLAVTQATISRDLDHLGAVKIRRDGVPGYALPDEVAGAGRDSRRLAAILGEWARSIEAAGPLIVVRTPAGSAHLVGVALDQAALPDIAGTISGDDTLFLAVRAGHDVETVARRLRALSAGEPRSRPRPAATRRSGGG